MIPANASSTPSPVAALVRDVGAPGKLSLSQAESSGPILDAMMAGEKNRKVRKLLRQRILVFAARREGNGITKSELFSNMRDVKPDEVMEELDNLVRLDLLVQYDAGPKTFLKSSTLPASFRYQITPLGRKVAASPAIEDLVVE